MTASQGHCNCSCGPVQTGPHERLRNIAEPLLSRLTCSLGGAASVDILDHDDTVCVAAVSGGQLIPATLQPGARVPAYRSASGRVQLASLTEDLVDRVLARATPVRITPHTIVDMDELARAIVRARKQGYALAGQELELGLRTLAVPIKSLRGDVTAALSITVKAGRMTAGQMAERYLHALIKYQIELNALLK